MCPFESAERRLNDAVLHWAEALEAYFDPHKFRLKLQAAILSFRSVTFVLQAQKSHITGFEEWYTNKQRIMREDPKMRWLVEARNFIEKQGDLVTRSRFLVTFSNSWNDKKQKEYALAPDVMPEDVAQLILNSISDAKINDEALLKFDRIWVDSSLPDDEVLTSLIHCYQVLQEVIDSGHALFETPIECETDKKRKASTRVLPRPMDLLSFPKIKWFKLKRGQLIDYEVKTETISRSDFDKYGEKRPEIKEAARELKLTGSFREMCLGYFAIARILLQKDGYHGSIAVHEANGMPQILQLRMEDRADKHALMRELGTKCKLHKAVWFIMIGEAWVATLNRRLGPHAEHYPNRRDALTLQGVHKDGTQMDIMATYTKVGNTILLDETVVNERPASGLMNPIIEAIIGSR